MAHGVRVELPELCTDPAGLGEPCCGDRAAGLLRAAADVTDEETAFSEANPVERVGAACFRTARGECRTDLISRPFRVLPGVLSCEVEQSAAGDGRVSP
ncbi:hypothetical protein [Streptomyces sp. NPDC059883]|uniref:hypothetical protein n=1 Tax=unclassified Streptomyces TaxID=2593676 RepID=UPI00364AE0B5